MSVARFIELRYDTLARLFPHKPFSVLRADNDFFAITYRYLLGEEIPEAKSVYERNYYEWIKTHRNS